MSYMGQINAYKRLWAAVFLQAVDDVWSGGELDARTARRWIASEETKPTSFIWCCGLFEIDPERAASLILSNRISMRELRQRVQISDRARKVAIDKERLRGWGIL